jgi:transcriptional regulator with XRE-family HTH domain
MKLLTIWTYFVDNGCGVGYYIEKGGAVMKIGEAIKQYREEHGLSQRTFARRCDLSNAQISWLEIGVGSNGKPLTTPKKAVFWRAFISSITVDRDKNVNVEFHTAKVLAERLSMLNEITPDGV